MQSLKCSLVSQGVSSLLLNATERSCTVQCPVQGVCACVGIFCATHGRNGPIKIACDVGVPKIPAPTRPTATISAIVQDWSELRLSQQLQTPTELMCRRSPTRLRSETNKGRNNRCSPTARETQSLPDRIFVPSRTLLPQEAPSGENSWAEI